MEKEVEELDPSHFKAMNGHEKKFKYVVVWHTNEFPGV